MKQSFHVRITSWKKGWSGEDFCRSLFQSAAELGCCQTDDSSPRCKRVKHEGVTRNCETWMGLQGWAPSRVTPKWWALASFRAKLLPLRGWAGQAAFCLLILSSPRATAWSRLWSPVGMLLLSQRSLQCPRVWLAVCSYGP